MSFVHLHNHSYHSLLDGVPSPQDYAERASELGHSHLAITDHGNVDSALALQSSCKKLGVIPVFGCEFYIVDDINVKERGEKRNHVTVLAKNKEGWKNILQMVSESHIEGHFYKPRIDPLILTSHLEGTVILSGCALTFLDADWGINALENLFENGFPREDFYLEVMPHQFEFQVENSKLCSRLSEEMGISLVATNDCHYVMEGDDKSHEVLLAVQTKSKMSDPNRWKFIDTSFYFKTRTEMAQGFRKQNILEYPQYMQAIKNTVEVAEKCRDFSEIEKRDVCLPQVPEFKGRDQIQILKGLCGKGFSEKIVLQGKHEPTYRARYEEEMELIIKLGFVEYFLIVWEVIKWCEGKDIMTGPGRGSSAGSLICYLLNITKVDPIEYGLIFARFINPDRNDLPDIDTDFEDKKRHLIKKHLQKIYGEWNVASISTFSVMRGKSALRDVSRAFDISLFDVNKACDVVVTKLKGEEGSDTTIKDAFEMFEEGKDFAKKYPEVAKISTQLEGTVRQRGQHASAVIVSGENLLEGDRMSYVNGKNKEPIVNWEKDDAEHMGLMKLDVLGLKALTVLNMCKKLIEENHDVKINYDNIDLKDEKCLEEFNKGNTTGCFQLGTSGLRKFCQRVKIACFRDIVDSTSLYRPGTLHSGMADVYIKRKHGEESIPGQHKIIEEITADTYGVILYQEQMMWIIYRLAGLEWKIVDKIRKIVGKSQGVEAFKKYEDQFVEGCVRQKTISEIDARKLWNDLSSFGSYCLTGDTVLYRSSSNQHTKREITIEELYKYQENKNFKHRKLKVLSMFGDSSIKINTVNKVYFNGIKDVWYIKTQSGKFIKATEEHRFMVDEKWIELKKIKEGDWIKVTDLKKTSYSNRTGKGSGAWGETSPRFRKGEGITNEEKNQKSKLIKIHGKKCMFENCSSEKFIEMHHYNSDHSDNTDGNTILVCRKHHRFLEKEVVPFQKGYYTSYEKIIEIKYIGERPVYDVEMTGEPRNFIANKFISHNSFNLAHAVCYTVITFWTMFVKTYYAQEFMCSLLSCNDDKDKKNEYIEEAFRLGIDLRSPKVGKSNPSDWKIVDQILYAPFIEIAGVGDKTAAGFGKLNLQGFYDKDDKKPVSQRFLNILDTINAYDDKELTDDEADRINEFLGVSLIRNKLHKYKKLFGFIRKGADIVEIKDIGLEEIFADTRFYMGIITDMKMNYFTNKNGDRMSSISIILKDEHADCKIGFDNRFYEQHKAEIENCKDEYVIVGASAPRRAGALVCDSLWQINDLMAADIEGLKPNFVEKTRFRNRNLSNCEKCPLQKEAKAPILPSPGKNNMMIIGEAPNKEDDREGHFFSGKIGQILWRELGKYGLKREEFHVTGVGKCFPRQSKTLSKGHIKACSSWLDEEIKNLNPFFILAFGNTSLNFFIDEDSGIMKKSGNVEWSEKYGCWICWSIHPVSTLYNDENVRAFQRTIEKFSLKVKNFGFF